MSILSYSHPRWLEAVRSQASVLTHVGAAFPTVEVSEALAMLGEILPRPASAAQLGIPGRAMAFLAWTRYGHWQSIWQTRSP